MKIFLDTDVCIAILRGKEPALEERLKKTPIHSVALSSIVVAELYVGAEKAQDSVKAKKKLQTFLQDLPTIPFDEQEAQVYAEIRANLERKGIVIGANDMLIAATAISQNGKLITRNRREYERIRELQLEVW